MSKKRIAVLGILLESNIFAPVTRREDFEQYQLHRGDALSGMISYLGLADGYDWELTPILIAAAESGGPMDHDYYLELVHEIEEGLKQAAPLDGVFIYGHGAGRTTKLDDLDGDYFARVRRTVGPETPIVAELDLHANLSDQMVEAADILVGYRTNPHVDQAARARECCAHLQAMMNGRRPTVAYQRLPLVTAQIAQLTSPDKPYGKLMTEAERIMAQEEAANVTLLSGFSFADTAYNGFAVCVTTWDDETAAVEICNQLAEKTWSLRAEFVFSPHSIKEGVAIEKAAAAGEAARPRIYADIADNPGGGGRGNTIHLLKAFAEAELKGVMAGVYYDPALVSAAQAHGVGATFDAAFNTAEENLLSGRWNVQATVESLFHGAFDSRFGINEGQPVNLGPSATLSINNGTIRVIICSLRNQVLSPEYFSVAGLDVREANAVIVKSRGHFRAAFASVAHSSQVHEIDGPGLTTADISSVTWSSLPRPVFPIDSEVYWTPEARLKLSASVE